MEYLHDSMSRRQKAFVLLALDGFAMVCGLLVALQLRLGDIWPDQYFADGAGLFVLVPMIGMGLSWVMGVPRIVLRSFESRALFRLVQFAFAMSVVTAVLNWGFSFGLPRSIPGIWAGVFLMFALFTRLFLLGAIERLQDRGEGRRNVLVYGAGGTGQQLAAALRSSQDLNPVGFLDDNPALRRIEVSGLKVYTPAELPGLRQRFNVTQVILAMPSVRPVDRREMIAALASTGVEVLTLPSFVELLDGRTLTDQLRPVSPDDLLGRDAVDLTGAEVRAAYAGRTVMVTGAGGSIGSELARQVIAARPSRLVLFDQSEYALYAIDLELQALRHADLEVVSLLGSVTDSRRVTEVLARYKVEIVLHAAAYKHVPMVEHNPLEGARNNIVGTQILADAAQAAKVERFILVSTDKAVRPPNVMGATKRMAELVIQDRQTRSNGTLFSMVRFGNVLGSSGSVIPLFRDQIQAGGPVTLTHPDVTRYFMTIPEAAQLVLLAGTFAEGGDVFVLDMGKPVRIGDLARSLIELSGLRVRDDAQPDGDIEIVTTGLRPGEKLYEELLIGGDVMATPHPKIMRAAETFMDAQRTGEQLGLLHAALQQGDADALRSVLRACVDGFGN